MSVQITIGLLVVLATASKQISAADIIPNIIQSCPVDAPNVRQCLRQSISGLLSILDTGYPAKNVPAMYPMTIHDFPLTPKVSRVKVSMRRATVYGPQNMSVTDFQILQPGRHFQLEVFYPEVFSDCEYQIDGELLFMKLQGQGNGTGYFYDMRAQFDIQLDHERSSADGIFRPLVRKIKARIVEAPRGNIRLDGLGAQVLSDAVHRVINENFAQLAVDFLPAVEKRIAIAFRKYANQLLAQFTSEQVFPGLQLER